MKKTTYLLFLGAFLISVMSFYPVQNEKTVGEICFKIKNDTGSSMTLHTGKGTAPMSNGTVKEFCLEDGAKLYLADKGQKGAVLVEVSSKVQGKTLNLSDLM